MSFCYLLSLARVLISTPCLYIISHSYLEDVQTTQGPFDVLLDLNVTNTALIVPLPLLQERVRCPSDQSALLHANRVIPTLSPFTHIYSSLRSKLFKKHSPSCLPYHIREMRPCVRIPFVPQNKESIVRTTVTGIEAFCKSPGCVACHQIQKPKGKVRIRR